MPPASVRSSVALAAALLTLTASASAQSQLSTNGLVLAASGQPVPGIPHALYPASTTNWVNPVVDETGNVMFAVSSMTDDGSGLSGLATINNRAYLRGSTPSNMALYLRANDPAPLVAGSTLNTSTGPGPSTTFRTSRDGRVLWGSWLSAPASSADDTILYVGTAGNWTIVAREGGVAAGAPGVAGCTYASGSAFNSVSLAATGLNSNGDVLAKMKLQGGDVSGTANDDIWYVGQPNNLQVMLREGDAVGANVCASLGFTITQLNGAGQVLHDQTFSTSLGGSPATSSTDKVLLLYTPGLGNSVYLREGSPAPGTVGATFNNSANSWTMTGSGQSNTNNFNASGESCMSLQLFSGDVSAGVNDMGVYVCSPTGQTLVIRRGDAAPGIPGTTMDTTQTTGTPTIMAASPCISDSGAIAFRGRVAGASVTTANDTGLWGGMPGSLQLIYREGDVAPGTGGLLFGDAAATVGPFMNANGWVLFQNRLAGTTDALYLWNAINGGPLQLVAFSGDQLEVSPGVFKTVSGFGNVSNNNSEGSPMMFGNDLAVALRVTFTDNSNAVVLIPGASSNATTYCTAGTTTNGCNALIGASGTPSAAATSGFTLTVGNVEGQKVGLIFYGLTGPHSAQWGTGSSFLCVKSPTQRTPSQSSGGTLDACDGTLSVDWLAYLSTHPTALGVPFVGGETVYAQGWFRDPPASKTTNLSNALQFVVLP